MIAQSLTYVADDPSKLPSLLSYLAQPYNPPVLIFTSTQTRATSLAEELVLNGIQNVDCLHAGLTHKEREDAASRMRKGESWVMVTTEVMGRGMDFKGVREVINYDFPTSVQSYVHRIGRTGRAGREGKAVTFFTDEDAPYLKMYVCSPVAGSLRPTKRHSGSQTLYFSPGPAFQIGFSNSQSHRSSRGGSWERSKDLMPSTPPGLLGDVMQSRGGKRSFDNIPKLVV